jgi:16S rRNA (cytosine967-C5)-methyltransferase
MYSAPPDPLGTATRRAALRVLDAVLRRGESLEAALPGATRAIHGPDRGLAHAIAAETLRRLPDLDALIDSATRLPLAPDAKARMALRIALVQVLALGTPPHAAIATVLPLVDGGPRKLVHGVFGTLIRGGATLPPTVTLPSVVADRWRAAWGEAMVAAAAHAIAAPPPLDLTLADPGATDLWVERLGGVSLLPGHVRITAHDGVAALPGYDEGAWWVQDIAASLPVRLLGEGAGTAIDLCAAPGGKTLQLAAAGWQVTAVDQSASRLERVHDNLSRTRMKAEVIKADVRSWSPPAPADAVLIDAPCSATGIFRRHPDVIHRAHPALIADMAVLQAAIFLRAADWVKPGGRLVYATCSLEPEEGEAQLDAFLAARPDFTPAEVALPLGGTGATVRTLPGMLAEAGGCDGFFVAHLRRG